MSSELELYMISSGTGRKFKEGGTLVKIACVRTREKSTSKRVAMSQGKSEGKNKGGAGKVNYDATEDRSIDTFKDSWGPR